MQRGQRRALQGVAIQDIAHEDGTPRFGFVLAARDEYRNRGGTDNESLGTVTKAVPRLLKEGG